MSDSKFKVEFREGKKIITHPNGTVSEYPKAVIENHRQRLLERKQDIDTQIVAIDKDLTDIDAAV